jgi:D-alanyl-D-alanine carboxypeptidase (penicillin-binding protein 5/6)
MATTIAALTSAVLVLSAPTAAPSSAAGVTPATVQQMPAAREVTHGTVHRPIGEVTPPPRIRAQAWVVVDMATGDILGKHRARARLPQASTIKLLTALTANRRIPATEPLRATRRAADTICSCAGVLAGRQYTRAMLLAGMLVKSGNDAAEALAGADPRGRARFIAGMNRTAARLGAADTVAQNPSGLDQTGGHSSARDLVVLLREASERPAIAGWLDTASVRFGAIGGRRHWLESTTDYLRMFADSYAAKNGYTTRAGNTLVVASRIEDPQTGTHEIGAALLDAQAGYTTAGARGLVAWAVENAGRLAPVGNLPGS